MYSRSLTTKTCIGLCVLGLVFCVTCSAPSDKGAGDSGAPDAVSVLKVALVQAAGKSVAAGEKHTCAVLSTGSVSCWGKNGDGQLGDGTTIDRATPIVVSGIADVRQVATGDSHSCAMTNSGQVFCWGKNYNGQLGDGTFAQRKSPVAVGGLADAVQISAGNA